MNLDPLVRVIYSAAKVPTPLAKNVTISTEVFYTKSSQWKHEQEWRLFAEFGASPSVLPRKSGRIVFGSFQKWNRQLPST